MSKFINMSIDQGGENHPSVMYALDEEGTIWSRLLDSKSRPFEEYHRSVAEKEDLPT